MDPNFVVATLIFFLETQRAVGYGEGAVHADLPFFFRTKWFEEPAHV